MSFLIALTGIHARTYSSPHVVFLMALILHDNRYYFEITELLNTVPREMLLLLKMNDCLRHIDRELGAPVNSSLITAEESVRALLKDELEQKPTLGKRVWAWWDYYKVQTMHPHLI